MEFYKSSPSSSDQLRLAGLAAGTGLGVYAVTKSPIIPVIREKMAPVTQFVSDNPYVIPAALGAGLVGTILVANNRKKRLERGY
jgi:hypothetical protein